MKPVGAGGGVPSADASVAANSASPHNAQDAKAANPRLVSMIVSLPGVSELLVSRLNLPIVCLSVWRATAIGEGKLTLPPGLLL